MADLFDLMAGGWSHKDLMVARGRREHELKGSLNNIVADCEGKFGDSAKILSEQAYCTHKYYSASYEALCGQKQPKKEKPIEYDVCCETPAFSQCGACLRWVCQMHSYPMPELFGEKRLDIEWCIDCVLSQLTNLSITMKSDICRGKGHLLRHDGADLYAIAQKAKFAAIRQKSIILVFLLDSGKIFLPRVKLIRRLTPIPKDEKVRFHSKFKLEVLKSEEKDTRVTGKERMAGQGSSTVYDKCNQRYKDLLKHLVYLDSKKVYQ